jgi:hypothetical protein
MGVKVVVAYLLASGCCRVRSSPCHQNLEKTIDIEYLLEEVLDASQVNLAWTKSHLASAESAHGLLQWLPLDP